MSILPILNFALNSTDCPIINMHPFEFWSNNVSQWSTFSNSSCLHLQVNCRIVLLSLTDRDRCLRSQAGSPPKEANAHFRFMKHETLKNSDGNFIEYHEIQWNKSTYLNSSSWTFNEAFTVLRVGDSRIGKSLAQYLVCRGFSGKPCDFSEKIDIHRSETLQSQQWCLHHLGLWKQLMVYCSHKN